MKASRLNLFSFLALMLLCTGMHLQAQQSINVETDGKKITIIKKYIDKDGVAVTEKIIKEMTDGSDVNINEFVNEMTDGMENVDIDIEITDEDVDQFVNTFAIQDRFMKGLGCKPKSSSNKSNVRTIVGSSNKGKLGVYLNTNADLKEGIEIQSIVEGGAAEKTGLKAGDIILSINGVRTNDYNALKTAMRDLKIDDIAKVDYQRGTEYFQSEMTLQAHIPAKRKSYAYKHVRPNDRSYHKVDPCKPFIGITLSIRGENGVPVHRVVEDTPASRVALQKGDRILSIDGTPVTTQTEIIRLRDLHKAGDYFTIGYLRDGEEYEVEAQFKPCGTEQPVVETPVEKENINASPSTLPATAPSTLKLESISAFPNPTLGRLTLQFKGEAIPTTVRLTDGQGCVLMTEQLKDFSGTYNDQINLSGYPAGFYFITIAQANKSYTERIVVNGDRL